MFKLTPQPDGSWQESTLHRFRYDDGAFPSGSLVLDANGNLYGTTETGSAYEGGVVFEAGAQPRRKLD